MSLRTAWSERLRRLLPGLWAGLLLCIGLVAAPAAFALLVPADAGRLVGRLLAQEAYASLVVGALLLVLERMAARRGATEAHGTQFSTGMVLALGALFCTVAGYFGLLQVMAQARLGQGPLSFGQVHAASAVFFAIKSALVLALAWRAGGTAAQA